MRVAGDGATQVRALDACYITACQIESLASLSVASDVNSDVGKDLALLQLESRK